MAASVGVHNRVLVFLQSCYAFRKHSVSHLSIGTRPYRPGYNHAIIAVDQWGEVDLTCGYAEFSDIGKPLFVGFISMEIAIDEVRYSRRELTFV